MSNALIPGLIAGALTGAVAGGVAAFTLASGGAEPARTALDPTSQSPAQLAATVDVLQQENEDLRHRVASLETRASMAEGMPAAREAVEFEGMSPSNEELLASLEQLALALNNPSSGVLPAGFRAGVEQTIADMEAQEEAERDARREEQRITRNIERVDKLTEDLALAPWQGEEMLAYYNDRDAAYDALRDEMRQDGGWGGRGGGEAFREVREEYDARAQEILTAEQYEKYQEDNSRGFNWGSGRSGGGRGGGRGGG